MSVNNAGMRHGIVREMDDLFPKYNFVPKGKVLELQIVAGMVGEVARRRMEHQQHAVPPLVRQNASRNLFEVVKIGEVKEGLKG